MSASRGNKFTNWVRKHKVLTIVSCSLVGVLAVGGVALGMQSAQKYKNSQALLQYAEENGVISSEMIEELEANGGLAALGTEIVDPNTGETVVLTKDENGNITATVVKDADGNSTGAIVPGYNDGGSSSGGSSSGGGSSTGGGESGGGSSGGDTPAPSHSHTWVAHYNTRTVQTGTQYVVDVPGQDAVYENVCVKQGGTYCNQCGILLPSVNDQIEHIHNTGHGGCHTEPAQYEYRCVQEAVAEQGHYEAVYGTETYVDYYYCSDCGAHQ